MFLGKNGKFIEYGGGINLVYGDKDIEYVNNGLEPDPNVTFYLYELEKNVLPLVDDLILNTDGCFYRVKSISGETIETTRLTLQGTGGGGGGGTGGGGGGIGGSFSITPVGSASKVYSSTAERMELPFIAYYSGTDDNYLAYIKVEFKESGQLIFEDSGAYFEFNKENAVNLIDYINLFNANARTVRLYVRDKYGMERYTDYSISIVELALEARMAEIFYSSQETYTYAYNLSGGTSGVRDKKVIYKFFADSNPSAPPVEGEIGLNVHDAGLLQLTLNLSKLVHGSYTLEVQAQAGILGSTDVIKSNVLTHKVGYFKNESNPLLIVSVPEKTEQYTNIPLNFMLVSSEANKTYTLQVKVDEDELTTLNIVSNTLSNYPLYFETKGSYNLRLTVLELNLTYSTILSISEYTGNLPVIDPNKNDLMLYMNPRGQTNDSVNRDIWQDYNGRYNAYITDLHYSSASGWLTDKDGTPYLQLTSGGKLEIPDFKPFATDPTKTNASDSRLGYGITIEIDFEVDGVVDYDAELISCLSKDFKGDIQVGFVITGNMIKFYNSRLNDAIDENTGLSVGPLSSLTLVEGKRVRLSFVIEPSNTTSISSIDGSTVSCPMCYTYFNGKLSSAVLYKADDKFQDSSTEAATLKVDSTYGQVKLYGIRFYSSAAADRLILNNYTATLPTLEERENRYNTNNVYDDATNAIDYNKVSAEGYDLQIPYMTITGGYQTEKESKWQLRSATDMGSPGLPTGKKDYRLIDVEVVYPKNDLFKGYKNYSYKNTFANGGKMTDNFGNKANNGGCIMYGQGTSSMEYPVKNLRIRWKNDSDFYTVRPDLSPVEIICMKADYMESSGSHNTGAANLVDALYTQAKYKTPGQEHFGGEGKPTIVTSIKGYPCLIFYRPDENTPYEYVGKYNLNLDKATPEPFGFNHDDSDFGYLAPGDKYYEILYAEEDKNYKDPFVGQKEPTEGADYVPNQKETEKTVLEGEKVNSIHCFEFLDNSVEVCNFLGKAKVIDPDTDEILERYSYYDTWYGTFDKAPGWTLGFESRYPEDRVGYHDADMLWPLANWLNQLQLLRIEEEAAGLTPQDVTEIYEYSAPEEYSDSAEYFIEVTPGVYERAYIQASEFLQGTHLTRTLVSSQFTMKSLERFKREFHCYLDENFLLFYYIFTEALLMADSRVKNMMIATWGKEKRSYVDIDTGETVPTDNYIFYPIFYDMDTMLGLDNTGVNRFTYYDNDNSADTYNGDEVLWLFVRDALSDKLPDMYNKLESSLLNIDVDEKTGEYKGIIPYFNNNQANMANEAFYNSDAQYKYLRPAREGYYDGLNDKSIAAGTGPYLYAAQGDRSINREFFITNRIKYLRGQYNSNRFKSGDRIEFRWGYPKGSITDSRLAESVKHVKPSGRFDFVSLQTAYAGVRLGANGPVQLIKFDGEEQKTLNYTGAQQANGTEAYILGVSNLQDLGDLSDKYMQKFIMPATGNKIRRLILGNSHKDYYNPYWRPNVGQSAEISLAGCTYLQSFNLQNCGTYNNVLNFAECPIIETILLTGSSVSGLTLPVNGLIKELRLPTSITVLNINSHTNLTADNLSIGSYDYGTGERIGETDAAGKLKGSYVNNYQNLKDICIINTPIDTYEMVKESSALDSYCIHNFNWTIENNDFVYCNTADTVKVDTKTYYLWSNADKSYMPVLGSDIPASQWSLAKDKVYLVENGEINRIPVLDFLLEKQGKNNAFIPHSEALIGNIHINVAGKANEFSLYQKYHALYPSVNITYGNKVTLENAHRIEFYNVESITNETEPYYSVLTDGSMTLDVLTSSSGPAGSTLETPTKPSTNTEVFTFSGIWVDVYNPDAPVEYNTSDFANIKPDAPMKLVPTFITSTKYYDVKFYDWDRSLIKTVAYEYNQAMASNPDTPLYMNRFDDLDETHRYTFLGWISESDKNNNNGNPPIIDLNTATITYEGISVFAFYRTESVYEYATNIDYFNFTTGNAEFIKSTLQAPDYVQDVSETIKLQGVRKISIKPEYRKQLGGKITLPSFDKEGNPVVIIDDFESMSNVTHIYFLPDAQYEGIVASITASYTYTGFTNCQSLKTVEFPDTMRYIGNNTFNSTPNLETLKLGSNLEYIADWVFNGHSKLKLTELPDTLTYLGTYAFGNCSQVELKRLPKALKQLRASALSACRQTYISNFGYTESAVMAADDSMLEYIGDQALATTANSVTGQLMMTIRNSVKHLADNCFDSLGSKATSIIVNDESGILNGTNLSKYFGSTAGKVTLSGGGE